MQASAVSTVLDAAFDQLVGAPSVEEGVISAIARMSLRHMAARAIVEEGERMLGIERDMGGTTTSRCRHHGFLADSVVARAGRADCCGRPGRVNSLCSFCTVIFCDRCTRMPTHEMAGACRAGVFSPCCACMYDGRGGIVPMARGATFMLDDGSGMLRPVWFGWP